MNNLSPPPAEWETLGHDLWDDIAAVADRDPRLAATITKAARYTVHTFIEQGGTAMPNPTQAALEKVLKLRQAYRNNPHALTLFDGILGLLGVDMTKSASADLAKAAASADPATLVQSIQALRDALELDGDTAGAGQLSEAIGLLLQAQGAPGRAAPATKLQKRAPPRTPSIIRDEVARLRQLAQTDPSPQKRAAYQTQYDAIAKEYR